MGHVKDLGVVIKEVNTGDADKILTIFTENYGKVSAVAKGAKRAKSSLVAGSQLLSCCRYDFFKSRDFYHINSCEVIESFYGVRNDMVKLTYAAHMIEIINDVAQENLSLPKVLKLFLNCLYFIANTAKSPELIVRIFEIRLMDLLGYAPSLTVCLNCGIEIKGDCAFSYESRSVICISKYCMSVGNIVKLSFGTLEAMRHIMYDELKNVFKFELPQEILKELGFFYSRYLREQLEKDYKKLDFLKKI